MTRKSEALHRTVCSSAVAFGDWADVSGRPVHDGRSRADQLLHTRRAIDRAVARVLGDDSWIQVIVVDLTTHRPIQYLPDPVVSWRRKLARERFAVAAHNQAVAAAELKHAMTLLETVERDPVRDLPDG